MDEKNIIPRGTLAKYKIDIKDDNFDIDRDDFTITLAYGMQGKNITIPKAECIVAAEGCFLSFDTSDIIGQVTAVCEYHVGDYDTGGDRKIVDMQMLCFVSPVPCPRFLTCPMCEQQEHLVEYTRILESDATATYELLCDCYGTVFVTRDLMNIYVLREHVDRTNE